MKKIITILFFFMFTFFLYSCDKIETKISDENIKTEIQNLIDAKSYETSLHYRIVTEEIEIKVNPLLTFQKYTDDNDKQVLRIYYFNKIMEGVGLEGFEVIVDDRDEKIYVNSTNAWYQGTYTEAIDIAEEIDYLLNYFDDETSEDIEEVQDIIYNALKNYKKSAFIDGFKEDDRTLIHYELEYNVYNVMKEIFDYFNQDNKLGYDDFISFIKDIKLEDIAILFKTFTVDVYFDVEQDNDIARIELDFMNILNNNVIIDRIQKEIDNEDIDVKKLFEYVKDFEVGININKINSLPEISIPNEAKNGHELKFIRAPFDPDELTVINVGTPFIAIFEENSQEKWYTFTLSQAKSIDIDFPSFGPNVLITDSNFNHLNSYNYQLSAGTYYLRVFSYEPGNYIITVK